MSPPRSWLLVVASACGSGGGSGVEPEPDGLPSTVVNASDLPITGLSAADVARFNEGDALFEEVCQEVNRKAHGYFHRWKPTDMVIWDNWRVLHSVEGCDPKYERRMQRTTIKGDYGLGYFEGGKKIGEVNREIAPLDLPA